MPLFRFLFFILAFTARTPIDFGVEVQCAESGLKVWTDEYSFSLLANHEGVALNHCNPIRPIDNGNRQQLL